MINTTNSELPTPFKSRLMQILRSRETSLGIVIVAVVVVLSTLRPEAFLSMANFEAIGNGMLYDLLMAAGLTIVLILWGIDLSVGSVLALASVTTAMVLRAGVPIPIAIATGILTAFSCGAVNGYLIARFRIAPFIVTLSMMAIARGLATVLTSGYYLSGLPDSFSALGRMRFGGVPIPIIIVAVLLITLDVLLRKWKPLHQMYFVGANPDAAHLSGLKTQRIIISGYVISSVLAGVAAVFMTSRLSMGFAGFGLQAELRAIAAAVLGGASFAGGSGSILGAVLGVTLLAFINNGFVLLDGSPNWQQAVSGLILLVAVGVDAFRRRKERRS
ncbi:MAG: ABC transporter permease [Spirochaeta sp.]|jgi:ribose/xylose/arabinose/galactoside ABC-type transport system permease subunit|nr:ABC transporter permease [Spirochaeta sp.]